MDLSRRRFIQVGGMGLLVAAGAPLGAGPAAAAEPKPRAGGSGEPLLVTVFLRGAADGLHLVPPTGDPGYVKLRGALALSETLAFTRDFSLHPELASLSPLIARGQLAVVHAVGSPHSTRSHFEAQDLMELGVLQSARLGEGWLTRALRGVSEGQAFSSLSLTSQQPLALRGSGAFAIGDPQRFGLPGVSAAARSELEQRYGAGADASSEAGARALAALAEYESALKSGPSLSRRFSRRAGRGRNDFSSRAEHLLEIDRAGLGLGAAFLEADGWDTHANQGAEQGQMARRIRDLGEGVAKLAEGFGPKRDWLLVVMTEFGRTVAPNGSRGSDHGHGSVMFVAGPRVRGGVYGDWAGLSEDRLYEGRDLPVLTDWRSVLHEVLHAHLGTPPPSHVFPGFAPERLGVVG